MLGWFRRFRPSPPLRCPSASAFLSFFLPFQGCPFRARCVVLVFSLSLFLCDSHFAFWVSKFHFIFIVISLSFSFHLPCCGGACVCVCTICIDVKLLYCAGGQQPIFLCCPTKLRKMWWMGSWTHEPVPAFYIYVYIVPPLGAYKPQLGSLLFYTVNVYCDFTHIYIYISYFSFFVSGLIGVFFARPMHFTSEFAMTVLSKCVCVWFLGGKLQRQQDNYIQLL